jgi:hypothetical protein
MYQIRHEHDKKGKKKAASKFDKPNEELFECVTCGFKVQKIKFN